MGLGWTQLLDSLILERIRDHRNINDGNFYYCVLDGSLELQWHTLLVVYTRGNVEQYGGKGQTQVLVTFL